MTAPAISEPIAPATPAESAVPRWFAITIRKGELAGHKLAVQARVVALVIIAGVLFYVVPAGDPEHFMPRLIFYESCLALLAGLAIVSYAINRSRFNRPWRSYLFIGLDFIIITIGILGPAVLFDNPFPPQMLLRFGSFIYFFLFVALVALSYSPTLMLWSGLVVVLSWSAGVLWMVALPDTVTPYSLTGDVQRVGVVKDAGLGFEPLRQLRLKARKARG